MPDQGAAVVDARSAASSSVACAPTQRDSPGAARESGPAGVRAIIALREGLLAASDDPALTGVTADDLAPVLAALFSPGSLELVRIDWRAPSATLDMMMRHEAVHAIADREDLRRRLLPADRACYGLFHAALPDEPLVFTEIALSDVLPLSIDAILAEGRRPIDADAARLAVFYSISATQPGLRGIALGRLLIARVVAELARERPAVDEFVTLSPMPGLRSWMRATGRATDSLPDVTPPDDVLQAACEEYLLRARGTDERPLDDVARFHLGNGARLDRILLGADRSARGREQSYGAMVSYRYERQEP